MTQPESTPDDRVFRLGLIVPSTNTVAERDFWTFSPPAVTVHTSRMYLEETTAEDERRMVTTYLPPAARDLATAKPDVVVFSCTSAGAVIGRDGEREMIANLGDVCGAPIVSTNAAVSQALNRRGLRSVAVVTAYIPDLTRRIAEGIEAEGVAVPQAYGMGIVDPYAIAEVTPDQLVAFAEENVSLDGIDGIFVSCTNMRGYETRERLAQWSGLPVVTSNHAALEAALIVLGLPTADADLDDTDLADTDLATADRA